MVQFSAKGYGSVVTHGERLSTLADAKSHPSNSTCAPRIKHYGRQDTTGQFRALSCLFFRGLGGSLVSLRYLSRSSLSACPLLKPEPLQAEQDEQRVQSQPKKLTNK